MLSLSRYVLITSGVAAGAVVANRELIGRVFNDNPLIPANAVLEFTSASDVGKYFGTTSAEYLRALFYFGFVSKTINSPKKLSFARYAKATAPARVYGGVVTSALAAFTAIAAGTLNMSIGGQPLALTTVNLSGAASMAAVATLVQTAVRAAAGSQYTNATVTYDATANKFTIAGTTSGAAAVIAPTGTVAVVMGLTAADAIISPGVDVQTIDAAIQAATDVSNNFGSFAFIPALVTAEITTAAAWTNTNAPDYMFCFGVPDNTTAETVFAAITGYAGCAMTLSPLATEFPEMLPMMIMAATDYTRRAGVQNYMFQSANLTPSVTTNALADELDGIRTNYYGVTQTAGQKIAFYQRGLLTGTSTAPADMNVYANEAWLRDAARAAIMSTLLALPEVPANDTGRGIVIATLQAPITAALKNGVISVGKTLTAAQRQFVSDVTGDPMAWQQVQNIGYSLTCVIVPNVNNGRTEYKAQYTLVYSKDDTIRKVEGAHDLI